MEPVYGRDRLLCIHQFVFKMVARVSYGGVLAVNGLPQPSKLPLVLIDRVKLGSDPVHHGLEGIWVGLAAKDENLMMRLASLVCIRLVTMCALRESDVACSQEEDMVAYAALAEVQGTGAFQVRYGSGSNLNTEIGSQWATYVGNGVEGGDMVEKPRASGPGVDGLPEGDLDVGELCVSEDPLAADGCDLGVFEGQRLST
jgi:hypothetical protein